MSLIEHPNILKMIIKDFQNTVVWYYYKKDKYRYGRYHWKPFPKEVSNAFEAALLQTFITPLEGIVSEYQGIEYGINFQTYVATVDGHRTYAVRNIIKTKDL